eukprot:5755955-Pyramimonas_sp.AAC.1
MQAPGHGTVWVCLPNAPGPRASASQDRQGPGAEMEPSLHTSGGKKHTDTINRRSPRKCGKIWEVGGKTNIQKIWEKYRESGPFTEWWSKRTPGGPMRGREGPRPPGPAAAPPETA